MLGSRPRSPIPPWLGDSWPLAPLAFPARSSPRSTSLPFADSPSATTQALSAEPLRSFRWPQPDSRWRPPRYGDPRSSAWLTAHNVVSHSLVALTALAEVEVVAGGRRAPLSLILR